MNTTTTYYYLLLPMIDTVVNLVPGCNDSLEQYDPKPVYQSTFWDLLKHKGCRFTTNVNLTICPLHEKGPANEIWLKEVTEEYALLQSRLMKMKEKIKSSYTNSGVRNENTPQTSNEEVSYTVI